MKKIKFISIKKKPKYVQNIFVKYWGSIIYEEGKAYLFHKEIKHTQEKKCQIKYMKNLKMAYQAHVIINSFFYISRNCKNVIKLSLSTIAVVWLGIYTRKLC